MKLLFVVVMVVGVSSVSYAQWQVLKEPQLWMVQEPPRANVAEPQSGAYDKQKNASDNLPLSDTQPKAVSTQTGSDEAGQNEQFYWRWSAIRQRLNDPDWRLFALMLSQTIIIIFQLIQSVNGTRSANAAKRSADVARKSIEAANVVFHLTQRPRIKMRSYIDQSSQFAFAIIFDMANYGGTNAVIGGCELVIFLYPVETDIDLSLSSALHRVYKTDLLKPRFVLKAGEPERLISKRYEIPTPQHSDFVGERLRLYARCYVSYRGEKDDVGGHYSTLCLRRLKSPTSPTLITINDPNYEYED